MDLRQLQSLLAVVDHGGFTAAARATHTVQSNISAHVARLEKELDAVLIDRASGAPTAEGDAVVARARRIENELTALEADVSSLRGSPPRHRSHRCHRNHRPMADPAARRSCRRDDS